jgi:hypothetical protein
LAKRANAMARDSKSNAKATRVAGGRLIKKLKKDDDSANMVGSSTKLILLEGNLPKPGNPSCVPTNQPTEYSQRN